MSIALRIALATVLPLTVLMLVAARITEDRTRRDAVTGVRLMGHAIITQLASEAAFDVAVKDSTRLDLAIQKLAGSHTALLACRISVPIPPNAVDASSTSETIAHWIRSNRSEEVWEQVYPPGNSLVAPVVVPLPPAPGAFFPYRPARPGSAGGNPGRPAG